MVSKSKGSGRRNNSGSRDTKLIVLDFTASEILDLDAWRVSRGPDYDPDIVKVVDDGWKVSLSYSDYYQAYFLAVTDKRSDRRSYEYTFCVKHRDYDRLIGILEYLTGIYLSEDRIGGLVGRRLGDW